MVPSIVPVDVLNQFDARLVQIRMSGFNCVARSCGEKIKGGEGVVVVKGEDQRLRFVCDHPQCRAQARQQGYKFVTSVNRSALAELLGFVLEDGSVRQPTAREERLLRKRPHQCKVPVKEKNGRHDRHVFFGKR